VNKLRLYSYWRSSCSWRVRLALELKGLQYEIVPVHLIRAGGQQHAQEYSATNPLRQVPVLELAMDGHLVRVAQSLAIIELLEELYPEPALLPDNALQRARARQIAEMVNAGIQPVQNLFVLNELGRLFQGADKKAWSRGFIQRGLSAIEALARETAGRFLVGDQVTVADLCVVPQLYNARRFELGLDEFPTLLRAEAACAELSAFLRAHPTAQPDAEP
jgi:maleylpyruvate isomerase